MTDRKKPVRHIVKSYIRDSKQVSPHWRGHGTRMPKASRTPPSYLGSPVEYVKDGKTEYKVINGTAYHIGTPDAVIKILEENRSKPRTERIRVWYGDPETGRDWEEEFDTTGYIGRSTGLIKIPLLINNSRSMGGGGLLDDNIIKIAETKAPHRILYQHPYFHKESRG